ASMIELAGRRGECEVLIVGRGGGSLEDLWAFNEEVVARAIHASPLPIVSAVGHEIDFTIADFVADHRAPTPSAAAELLSPDCQEILQQVTRLETRLRRSIQRDLARARERLRWLLGRLKHPSRQLHETAQRLDELERRLNVACGHLLRHKRADLESIMARLQRCTPAHRIREVLTKCAAVRHSLCSAMHHRLKSSRQQLSIQSGRLEAVSPLAVLGRGYAIVRKLPEGTIVRSGAMVKRGDQVEARLGRGHIRCRVEDTVDE
ncbi:MAG TPA: exodeoxyribonuclease VII large subunit, partial [Gammaproteobacteria bacterium]|nr:exodeoxyribonuclease VII large subunit [Gammaproteobacteria bacterium]